MKLRDKLDQTAWEVLHARPAGKLAEARGHRSLHYLDLETKLQAGVKFEHAWSDFLHAFYEYQDASFFTYPSPPSLSLEWQALLAGAAEWLSQEWGLAHPSWVEEPKYFLTTPWDPVIDYGLDPAEFIEYTLRCSPAAFRRRNVAFRSRNLIAL